MELAAVNPDQAIPHRCGVLGLGLHTDALPHALQALCIGMGERPLARRRLQQPQQMAQEQQAQHQQRDDRAQAQAEVQEQVVAVRGGGIGVVDAVEQPAAVMGDQGHRQQCGQDAQPAHRPDGLYGGLGQGEQASRGSGAGGTSGQAASGIGVASPPQGGFIDKRYTTSCVKG